MQAGVSHISPLFDIAANIARSGVDIYNNSAQFQIINSQLSANETQQVGTLHEGGRMRIPLIRRAREYGKFIKPRMLNILSEILTIHSVMIPGKKIK
jgi:hypothetical protein